MDTFYSKGLRFECQGSGQCCVSRGGYGYVYLTLHDRRRIANLLRLRTSSFTRKFCAMTDGIWHLKELDSESCQFLRDKKCSIYEARPTQCRTWPFWPEVLNAKCWDKEVASFCPGVGKGRLWTPEEIEQQRRAQVESEREYGR